MRTYSYWEHTVHLEKQKTAVRPAPPGKVDVLIVGAGFAGSWLAYFLKRRHPQLSIVICERDLLSYGASSRNAGFLSCGNISEWTEDAQQLGMEETLRTFQARINGIQLVKKHMGAALAVNPCGSVDMDGETAGGEALMQTFNKYLADRDCGPIFSQRRVNIGGEERDVYFNSFDAAVNPCSILMWLHKAIKQDGVALLHNTTVTHLGSQRAQWQQGSCTGALSYGHAFICTNAFARDLNHASDVEPARGQIMVTSPSHTSTMRSLGFLNAGYDYYRFIDDRLLVGGGRLHFRDQESTGELQTSAPLQNYLRTLAARILGHDQFRVDYQWAGIMGLRQGKHASISEFSQRQMIDSYTEDMNSCGGWGVTLTPVVMYDRANAF